MIAETTNSSQHPLVGFSRHPSAALVAFALLITGLIWPGAASASLDGAEIREQIEQTRRVDPEVLDLIEVSGHAPVQISLSLADSRSTDEVDPAIVELVQRLLPGEARLVQADVLAGLVDAQGLLAIAHHPAVSSIELDLARRSGRAETESMGTCVANTSTACLSGNFQVRVNGPFGPAASVGATSNQSAVFGFFGNTSNWEVLVKVLNGCAINNHYWVFAAGATSQNYSISVVNLDNNQARLYGRSCPLTDTAAFPCS